MTLTVAPAHACPWPTHAVFDPVRRALQVALNRGRCPEPDELNQVAESLGVRMRTASGQAVRFIPAGETGRGYELSVFETGRVATREGNWHDLFNALAWMSFPRTKAALNALHAAAIPGEAGRRGRMRDLLTLFDEGGAIIALRDASLEVLVRGFDWRELFWERRADLLRDMRILVAGHAVLEMARRPWPGITCKVLFMPVPEAEVMEGDALTRMADAYAANWLRERAALATPADLAPFPIFGYPGWLAQSAQAAFYDDTRYFRPFRPLRRAIPNAGTCTAGSALA